MYGKAIPKFLIVTLCILWLTVSTIASYPNFMTYYNEFISGERNGFTIAVDSNYDWGQDLKRLAVYAEKNNIQRLAVDYFGGGNPKYYLKEKLEPWWSSRGPLSGWFAVSASFRQTAFGTPIQGFIIKPEDTYQWLRPYVPVARIGSIFLYKLP